jgi:hypothetical protein
MYNNQAGEEAAAFCGHEAENRSHGRRRTMKSTRKSDRRPGRYGILANFRFYVDEDAEKVFEGITLDVSDYGFGFMTSAKVREGQSLTITKHSLPGFSSPRARVRWARQGPRCTEAGAEFVPAD